MFRLNFSFIIFEGGGISIIYNEINTIIAKKIKKYKMYLFFINKLKKRLLYYKYFFLSYFLM